MAIIVWITFATLAWAEGGSHTSCACKYQGVHLPTTVLQNFPTKSPAGCTGAACTKTPGMYANLHMSKLYGTTCAAWDQMPGTPWASSCPKDKDFTHFDYNWCQQPWCYVDASCPGAVPSSVFAGSEASHYSYNVCGSAPDCYTGIAWNTSAVWPQGCPYGPHGDGGSTVHAKGSCACKYAGMHIPTDVYTNYPEKTPSDCTGSACTKTPGQYKDLAAIKAYGTACAAWDQVPGTPWVASCSSDKDFCHQDNNWCQQPWCYVDGSCPSAVSSSVFKGSAAAYYSYNTCINTPDCYTNSTPSSKWPHLPAGCPFDKTDNGWYTKTMCPNGWTGVTTTTTTTGSESSFSSNAKLAAVVGGVAAAAMCG